MTSTSSPADRLTAVVPFWRDASAHWFSKSTAFDDDFRGRFLALYELAAGGGLDAAAVTPEAALGLVILLDQFPRNSFRGTPRMVATDPLARAHAVRAIDAGFDAAIERELRGFFYLPLSHAEDLADQERAVILNRAFDADWLRSAQEHCDIVRRFGRFPHRNAILGRASTPEEVAFLADGGFAG
jgi:uncharacterized protein (DUF924 family)